MLLKEFGVRGGRSRLRHRCFSLDGGLGGMARRTSCRSAILGSGGRAFGGPPAGIAQAVLGCQRSSCYSRGLREGRKPGDHAHPQGNDDEQRSIVGGRDSHVASARLGSEGWAPKTGQTDELIILPAAGCAFRSRERPGAVWLHDTHGS